MLAVGERGHQPAVTVWNLATGAVLRELVGGHRFGVGCITFSPCGSMVATMGFKHDRMLRVRGLLWNFPLLWNFLRVFFRPGPVHDQIDRGLDSRSQ